MKTLIIIMFVLPLTASARTSSSGRPIFKQAIQRKPASVGIKKLLMIDERKGCCSQHGGVMACAGKQIECKDGFISMCECVD